MGLRLNLGCGTKRLGGFTNIDVAAPRADIRHDCALPLPFDDGTVEEIRANHLIEHLTNGKNIVDRDAFYVTVFRDWRRVLIPGGKVIAAVPDIRLWLALFEAGHADWRAVMGAIYGYTGTMTNRHEYGFTGTEIIRLFAEAGFSGAKQTCKTDWTDALLRRLDTNALKAHWHIPGSCALSGHIGIEAVK